MAHPDYEENIFVNCPFDDDYLSLFNALVFAIHDLGFRARCARELGNGAKNRLAEIQRIIADCRHGVHDVSRTTLDTTTGLPRFNMPLELGLFLGCQKFGGAEQRRKVCLVLDTEKYRYQKFISDIAGQDICAHGGSQQGIIREVRNWLATASKRPGLPGGNEIWDRFRGFDEDMPLICSKLKTTPEQLVFVDYQYVVTDWLLKNPW